MWTCGASTRHPVCSAACRRPRLAWLGLCLAACASPPDVHEANAVFWGQVTTPCAVHPDGPTEWRSGAVFQRAEDGRIMVWLHDTDYFEMASPDEPLLVAVQSSSIPAMYGYTEVWAGTVEVHRGGDGIYSATLTFQPELCELVIDGAFEIIDAG